MYDVAIIGAGITGVMIARELSKYDIKICILEKESAFPIGTAKSDSAIIYAGFDAQPHTLKAKLNVKGSEMYEKVCEELGVDYKNNGSLVIGFDEKQRQRLNILLKRGNKNGVKDLRIIEKQELKEIEPDIADNAICALYAPTGAITSPYELCTAATGNAIANGVELKTNFEVIKINEYVDGYEIESQNDKIFASRVINAAGVCGDKIAKMTGDDSSTVTPEFDEFILPEKECEGKFKHTIFKIADIVNSTGDFIITAPKRGLINVAGIESRGLSAAPAIAEYVKQLLEKTLILQTKDNYTQKR